MKKIYKSLFLFIIALCVLPSVSKAQCTTFTSSVPYLETFSTITTASPLPQCWVRSNTVTCLSYTATTQAGFYYTPVNNNYFWSNGIQLNTGLVYSISVMYSTNGTQFTNWTNFGLLLGTTQTSTGLVPLVNVSPAVTLGYVPLTTTFVVSSPGIYYVAINGVSNGGPGNAQLLFDDLTITKPCSVNPINLLATSSSTAICLGETATITASGADTYTWTGGVVTPSLINVPSFTLYPNGNTTYIVAATSSITGCTATSSLFLTVNPTPIISIFTNSTTVCAGTALSLNAYGANTYLWSNGSNSTNIIVTPTATTIYTLSGLNIYGCGSTASLQITAKPLPTITVVSSKNPLCAGEMVTLTASGADTYAWSSPVGSATGGSISPVLTSNTNYTVVGTSTTGCSSSTVMHLAVSPCNGINNKETADALKVLLFPNPAKNEITVSLGNNNEVIKALTIYDATGKPVLYFAESGNQPLINVSKLANGIYFVKLFTDSGNYTRKFVKE